MNEYEYRKKIKLLKKSYHRYWELGIFSWIGITIYIVFYYLKKHPIIGLSVIIGLMGVEIYNGKSICEFKKEHNIKIMDEFI